MTFWWRRWMEHSRSNRCTVLPCWSARTWISTWRRLGDVPLGVDSVVAEGRQGERPGGSQGLEQLLRPLHHLHAFSSASGRRLQHHGIADLGHGRHSRLTVRERRRPRYEGHPGRRHGGAGGHLVPHGLHGLRRRTDEGEPGLGAHAREAVVLGEEAVPGVDGLGARLLRHLEDLLGHQVALHRGGRADAVGLVRVAHVQSGAIGVGVDHHHGDVEFPAGADDPDRDLPPVGHQDLLEHARASCGSMRRRSNRPAARLVSAPSAGRAAAYSGMLPCFFGGFVSRLSFSISRAVKIFCRVRRGRITSST